jgi:transmembrane sensor
MSDVVKFRMTAEMEEEAAAWVWRLDEENVSSQDRAAFEQWLRRDARHRRAYEELGGVWRSLDALADAKREEKIAVFATFPSSAVGGEGVQKVQHGWRPKKAALSALAACVLIAIGFYLWFQRGNEAQTLATAVGQQRTATLADGSIIYLNTNTILETHFDRNRRSLKLLKGEALFKVVREANRPFTVHAGHAVVRALGTEFTIRLRETRDVEVIVADGRVEVESRSVGHGRGVRQIKQALTVGQKLDTSAPDEPIAPMAQEALSNALAWHEGAMVFDGESLADAVAELNRYTDARLVVADARLRSLRVGGRFKAGDVDEFLRALEEALPVATRRTADDLVYIEPRR